MIRLWFEGIALKKWAIRFLTVFHCFPPFLCPRVNHSHHSSLHRSSLKSYRSNLLSSLFTKEWRWANRSEQPWAICYFLRANRSFAHKKHAISWKNPRANSNSQPWIKITNIQYTNHLKNSSKKIINIFSHKKYSKGDLGGVLILEPDSG